MGYAVWVKSERRNRAGEQQSRRAVEQRSSRAEENPPLNSPFNKGGLLKQLFTKKSLFFKEV